MPPAAATPGAGSSILCVAMPRADPRWRDEFHPWTGTGHDWLGVDLEGHVAVFATGGYGLVLPLMIANMSAFALARHWRHIPVYEALLAQDGIYLPHGGPLEPPGEEDLPVMDVNEAR